MYEVRSSVKHFSSAKDYWNNVQNQRKFFDEVGNSLNIKSIEEWKTVKLSTISKYGGDFVHSLYKGSLLKGTKHSTCKLVLEIMS
jgi:hypothetical protein